MKLLDMNFSGLAKRKRRRRDGTVLLLSLLLIVFIAREATTLQQFDKQQKQSSHSQQSMVISTPVDPAARKLAETMANSLNLPWYELLAALESVKQQHPDVFLTAVLPDARKQQVVIGGEVQRLEQLLSYIDSLNAEPLFKEVLLVNQQQTKPATTGMSFTLKLEWEHE